MPLFDYRCTDCEAIFEELVRTPAQEIRCGACGSPRVERQLSAFVTHSVGCRDDVCRERMDRAGHGCGGSCACHP